VFAIDASISAGQMLLWIGIALFGGARLISANAFSRLGDVVDLDLFRLDRLKPLARSGLVDILIIAGALAVSPLQSLDAQFRWYNYRFALIVAIPSAAILLLWPLRHVHRRIRAEKDRRIAEIDERIEAASQAPDDLPRFEALLAHRDRLREQHTWLLSSALLSRLFFYLIIPPLAWVGAALVERWVGRAIGG
jgi:hypothetical protein